jgi:hypothetical protein
VVAVAGIPPAVIGLALAALVRRSASPLRVAPVGFLKLAVLTQIGASLAWLGAAVQLALWLAWSLVPLPAVACALTVAGAGAWFRLLAAHPEPDDFPRLRSAP